tara:strand:+ start:425 stop:679 length:255 start_codon:yes stop_codon:yes gene_type:complete
MDSKFDFGAMDKILEKAAKDETGEIPSLINDLILTSTKAGKAGFDLKELATVTTMGWFVSQEPELQSIVEFLLSKLKTEDEYIN